MRQAVRDYFIRFSEPLEGIVPHMYQDIKGLVTVGMGNLIEPIQLGWAYPWRRKDGSLASQSEYIAEWNIVNSRPELAQEGWMAATRFCNLHLSREDIITLVYAKMDQNEVALRKLFHGYDEACADLQLMLHSWAWAVGPASPYPRMFKFLNLRGYGAAANECDINPKKGTIVLRNAANRQMLLNAAWARDNEWDYDKLMYGTPRADGSEHTVVNLQHALSLLGFSLAQDGKMGPKTLAALQKFQTIHKLKADGVAGPLTWAAIQTALRHR